MNIKESATCNFCDQIDDIQHFFFYCPMVQRLWISFFDWWNAMGYFVVDYHQFVHVKQILFGVSQETDACHVLNFCLLHTKFYIYKHRLFRENELDIRGLKNYLWWKIRIEKYACTNGGKNDQFQKFIILYDSLQQTHDSG